MLNGRSQLLGLDEYDVFVADITPIPIILTDAKGWCLYVNASWIRLTGLDKGESEGLGWLNALAPQEIDKLHNLWNQEVSAQSTFPIELRLCDPANNIIWVQMTSQAIADASGNVLRVNAFSDITNIMALSNALAQSREEFRLLAEAMPQLVWSATPSGLINYFNEPWLNYTGLTVRGVEEGKFSSIVHPDDIEETGVRWKNALASGQGFEMQYRLLCHADKSYKWFIARSTPIYDVDGTLVRWVGTATDIDEQKRSAEKLEFVLEAANTFSSTLDLQAICEEFSWLAVKHFCDWCFITLAAEDGSLSTVAVSHRSGERVPYVADFCRRYPPDKDGVLCKVISSKKPLLTPLVLEEDISKNSRSAEHLEMLQQLKIYSSVIVPLSTEAGKVYGTVTLISSESRRIFEKGDVEVAELVARRAAVAIQNAKAFNAERMAAQNLRFIAKASELLFDSFDVQGALQRMLNLVVEEITDFAVVIRIENESHLRCIAVAHGDPSLDEHVNSFLSERPYAPETELSLVKEINLHQPVIKEDLEHEWCGVWEYLIPEVERLELRTSLTIPLYSRGSTYGALVLYFTNRSNRSHRDWNLPLLSDLGRRTSIAIENAMVYTRERRIAETLQKSLLPPSLPLHHELKFCAEYVPSSKEAEIGGDWYDAFTLKDGTVVISVGDVIGRGLKAASMMGLIRQAIGVMAMNERDPATVLNSVDYLFNQYCPNSMATVFLAFIDLKNKKMHYANAGHPFAVLRFSNRLVELNESRGLPLGLRNDFAMSESSSSIDIHNVQLLVMYTDGLVESTHDILAGEARLHQALHSDVILHVHDQARFIRDVCAVNAYTDDVAILTMRFDNGEHWSFDAENARAAHDSRGEFVRYLERYAVDPQSIPPAELIFGELIGNVVRHAPGPIDVHVDWSSLNPILHVTDRGSGTIGEGELPHDPLSEGGRGLFIIKAICISFTVERIEGYGNHVAVVLPIERKFAC